jgi:hypothetical protein
MALVEILLGAPGAPGRQGFAGLRDNLVNEKKRRAVRDEVGDLAHERRI